MKAHSNVRSRFVALPALLMLLGIFLVLPAQVMAQENNGRPPGATAGPVIPADDDRVVDELNASGCDTDSPSDCPKLGREVEHHHTAEGISVGARTLTQSQSFQIQTGAPINSVHVDGVGNIGFGTQAPTGRLHVVAKPGSDTAGDIFVLDNNGNLELGGLLTEASSVLLKENFSPVDAQTVLEILADMPISTWNYKTDDPTVRHMGPMAQDFYAAFGLGADDTHLAPLDANGVAMAAIQALYQQGQAQAAHINTLEQQNALLLQRLEALEAKINAEN